MGYVSCREDAEKQWDDVQWATESPSYLSGSSQTLSLQTVYELQQEHKFLQKKEAKELLLKERRLQQQLKNKTKKHKSKQISPGKSKKVSKNKPKFKKQKLKNAEFNRKLSIPEIVFVFSLAEEIYSAKPNKRLSKQNIVSIHKASIKTKENN